MKIFEKYIKPRLDELKSEGLEYLLHNEITKADFIGIDSVRFLSTAKFAEKLKKHFNLKLKNELSSKRFFSPFDFYTKPQELKSIKLDNDKVSLKIYHSTASNDEARSQKLKLDSRVFIELHGLNQYKKDGAKIQLNAKTIRILEFIFKNSKQNRLLTFDLDFDYLEKGVICYDYALSKASFIASIPNAKPSRQAFKTCLYIQKAQIKDGYQAPLTPLIQNITLYDKQEKNHLETPLTRLEFCFLA